MGDPDFDREGPGFGFALAVRQFARAGHHAVDGANRPFAAVQGLFEAGGDRRGTLFGPAGSSSQQAGAGSRIGKTAANLEDAVFGFGEARPGPSRLPHSAAP